MKTEEQIKEEIRYHMRCLEQLELKVCEHTNAIEELEIEKKYVQSLPMWQRRFDVN